jgi:hypothetical protein
MKKHCIFAIVLILFGYVAAILCFVKLNNKLDTVESLLQESKHILQESQNTDVVMKELLMINGMLQGLPHIKKERIAEDLYNKEVCKDLMKNAYNPSIECPLSNVVVYSLSNDLISCDCLRK